MLTTQGRMSVAEPNDHDAQIWVFAPHLRDRLPAPRPWLADERVGVIVRAHNANPFTIHRWPPNTDPADLPKTTDFVEMTARQLAAHAAWYDELAGLAGRDSWLPVTYFPDGLGTYFIPLWLGADLDRSAELAKAFFQTLAAVHPKGMPTPRAWPLDIEGPPARPADLFDAVRFAPNDSSERLFAFARLLQSAGADFGERLFSAKNRHLLPIVSRLRDRLRGDLIDRVIYPAIEAAFGPGRFNNYATEASGRGAASFPVYGPADSEPPVTNAVFREPSMVTRAEAMADWADWSAKSESAPPELRTFEVGDPRRKPRAEVLRLIEETERLGSVWFMHPANPKQHESMRTDEAVADGIRRTLARGSDAVLFDEDGIDWTGIIEAI